jgi:CHC2 zinc finger
MTGRKPLISADRLAKIRSRVPMPALVAEGVAVQRAGRGEYLAVCPFHAEQTPSFRVYSDHAHCFGCGWHGDQIRWLMDHDHLGFLGAVHHLCNWAGIADPIGVDLDLEPRGAECEWHPVHPIPPDAPPLLGAGGASTRVFNPKRAGERWEWSSWRPAMVHPYRSAVGLHLGFVLRIVPRSGKKFTPTVTYCQNDAGERRWCVVPFARPLPLYGLERLAARPTATVVLVEGEKTAEAAQRLLPAMVTTTWPGGSKAYRHVDFTPLRGREVICIADADQPGRDAFCGRRDRRGRAVPGILELLIEVAANCPRSRSADGPFP